MNSGIDMHLPPTDDSIAWGTRSISPPGGCGWWVNCWFLWFGGDVSSVRYTPKASITGRNTDTRLFELIAYPAMSWPWTPSGDWCTEITAAMAAEWDTREIAPTQTVASLQMDTGVNATGGVPLTITLVNPVFVDQSTLPPADRLYPRFVWKTSKVGAGLPDPGGILSL
jgi:hypothetical protein